MATKQNKPADITKSGPQSFRDLQAQNNANQGVDSAIYNALMGLAPVISQNDLSYNSPRKIQTPMYNEETGDYFGRSQYDPDYLTEDDMQKLQDNANELRYENQSWTDVLANGVGKMLGTAGTTFLSSLVGLPYGIGAAINQGRFSAIWDNSVTQGLASIDKWMEENMTNYQSQAQMEDPHFRFGDMNWWADNVIKNVGFTIGAGASMAVGAGTAGLFGRALGFVNKVGDTTKTANTLLAALFSATGEGMIEARQGVEERNKLETQKLNDSLAPEYEALRIAFDETEKEYNANKGKALVRMADGSAVDPAYLRRKEQLAELQERKGLLDLRKEAGLKEIEESGQRMGNMILTANIPVLMAGDLIQFGKGINKSFDNARHAAQTTAKYAKPTLVGTKKVGEGVMATNKVTGKNIGMLWAGTKGLLTEGSEEMNQQWIQSASGAYYNENDANDYWKAVLDPEAYKETAEGLHTLGNAISQGFKESWGDPDQWEQFVIGGLTGLAGTYMPTKIFNQDKSKAWYDPRRYGEWQGGAFKEIQEFNEKLKQYEENINDLNKVLESEDFPARIKGLTGHTYNEEGKRVAVEADDQKAWKDADDKQTAHDIQTFVRAGKLDDLRAIYAEIGRELDDEDIESIIKSTTKKITAEEDKQNHNKVMDENIAAKQREVNSLYDELESLQLGLLGSVDDAYDANRDYVIAQSNKILDKISRGEQEIETMKKTKEDYVGQEYYTGPYVDDKGNRTKSNDELRSEIKHNADELNRKLNSYLDSIDEVQKRSNGNLTKDQEDNLVYLHHIYGEKDKRFQKIMKDKVRPKVPSKFLLKTDATPEQLSKKYASSDLAFSRDENTPKGYVEVDTSLMNDAAFASFFAENVIWGQNIRPTYTPEEIEEELKAQEEDQKYSLEEQKKRREERARKRTEAINKKEEQSKKDREEQQNLNVGLIRKAFVNFAMQKGGKSLQEAMHSDELNTLFNDINDALKLRNEAAEYEDTFERYIQDPSLVDKAKAKEQKKIEEDNKQKDTDNKSMEELLAMSDVDLGNILSDSKKGKNKSGNKARKALGMKNAKQKVGEELDKAVKSGAIDEDTASDAMKLFETQLDRMSQEEDDADMDSMDKVVSKIFDTDTEAMNDPDSLLSDKERQAINDGKVEFDEEEYDKRVSKAKDAINSISDPIAKQIAEIEASIDSATLGAALEEKEEDNAQDAAVRKATDEENQKKTSSKQKRTKRNDEPEPLAPVNNPQRTKKEIKQTRFTSEGTDQSLSEDKRNGEKGNNIPLEVKKSNWHPWRSATSEISYYSNEPYQPSPNDPNGEIKKRRYDAVKRKLEETGAYTARKAGKIRENMTVGFKVFQDVNDEAGDFVIFITDEHGNIIGDLPSNDPRFETSSTDVSMDALYRKIKEEWDDASDSEKEAGMQSKYTSQVDHLLIGKVKYQEGRQTVSQLSKDSGVNPQFAIKVGGGVMLTQGVEGVNPPLTGNTGQPYVLVETPRVHDDESGIKYYAVPIITKTIGELDDSSLFMQVLKTVLYKMKQGTINDAAAHNILESLIAVGSVHVNLAEGSNTKKALGIRITTFDRENGQEKGVPYTIFEGTRENMNIDEIVSNLSRFHVNVSANYINSGSTKFKDAGLTVDGKPVDYNTMIAEVAMTNAADLRTVNDWFTIKPLEEKGSGLGMVTFVDKVPAWSQTGHEGNYLMTPQLKGKENVEWTIKPNEGFRVYDEKGVEIKPGDKIHTKAEKTEAKILAAQAFGQYHLKTLNMPYACMIGGKTYIYEPDSRKLKTYQSLEDSPKYNFKNIKELEEAKARGEKITEVDKYNAVQAYLSRQQVEDYYAYLAEEEAKKAAQVDHTAEVTKTIEAMKEESSHFHLVRWDEKTGKYVRDPNGDYYQDDRDNSVHARVSNVNEADEEIIEANKKAGFGKINEQLKTASTGAGNSVDTFVRRFFGEAVGMFEGINWKDKEEVEAARELAEEVNNIIGNPNINKEEAINMILSLAQIKANMGADWEIDSSGIVASGLVSFDGENVVNVAGTVDLLVYNKKTGQYGIIDMKTHLAGLFDKNGKLKTDVKTQAKLAHWRAQQTLYKQFLEKKYGIKIAGIRIMPFGVNYSTNFSETGYEVEDGVLKDKGITVDVHPVYDGKLIQLSPKTDTKYSIAQLPESVKRILSMKDPVVTKPEEKEVPLKSRLVGMVNKVPKGRSLKEFVKEKYKDNEDVMKLIDILEENKNSAEPVLMTAASQSLIMQAVNSSALSKAAQKAQAEEKHNITLDIPENVEEDEIPESEISQDVLDIIDELSEDLQRKVKKDRKLLSKISDMVERGNSIEDIEMTISRADTTIKHKKATTLPYQVLDLDREIKWMDKNLPQLSRERKVQIIKGLIQCSDGSADFGRLENGIILIGNKAGKGTVYHEAFHAVVQFFMTDEEINKLFQAAKERYGDMPLVALEERLADDFAAYVEGIDYEDNKIKKFFKILWDTIKSIFNNKSYIDTLYRNINTGVYSGKEFKDDRNNAFSNIVSESRNLTKSYEYITDTERARLEDSGVDRNTYNALTKEQQEYMLHCAV